MPIKRAEFEKGKFYSPEEYLLELFKSYADFAFSLKDLIDITTREGHKFSETELLELLSKLTEQRKIQSKNIEGIIYYGYLKRMLGFRRE